MLRVCDLPQHYIQTGLRGWDTEKHAPILLEITYQDVSHQSRPYTWVRWSSTPTNDLDTSCYWSFCDVPVDLDSLREMFTARYRTP